MMRQTILTIFSILWLSILPIQTSAQELSPAARISLITCGPGQEMYSFFGHSALWVNDPVLNIDRMYNYGTFDFSIPNFYWEFAKGRLYYMLSVTRSESFFREYISEERFIIEQVLNLTPEENLELFRLLEINYQPENRHYWYDFFKDNCSTRIRDIVAKATGGRYLWPVEPDNPLTFRQLLKPYVKSHPWERTGMFFLLAAGADQKATRSDYMFLPDELYNSFGAARTSLGVPLVSGERTIFMPNDKEKAGTSLSTPMLLFSILLLVSIWISVRNKNSLIVSKTFISLVFVISGLIGVLIAFMWFFSEHWTCKANIQLAWANPLNLILAVLVWVSAACRIVRLFSRLMLVVNLLFLISLPLWQQRVPVEGIILWVTILTVFYSLSGFRHPPHPKPEYQAK